MQYNCCIGRYGQPPAMSDENESMSVSATVDRCEFRIHAYRCFPD